MGHTFWSATEERCFQTKILPLSQYVKGRHDKTRIGLHFDQLALVMQKEMGADAKRKYNGPKLFQHYYQQYKRGGMRDEIVVRDNVELQRVSKIIEDLKVRLNNGEFGGGDETEDINDDDNDSLQDIPQSIERYMSIYNSSRIIADAYPDSQAYTNDPVPTQHDFLSKYGIDHRSGPTRRHTGLNDGVSDDEGDPMDLEETLNVERQVGGRSYHSPPERASNPSPDSRASLLDSESPYQSENEDDQEDYLLKNPTHQDSTVNHSSRPSGHGHDVSHDDVTTVERPQYSRDSTNPLLPLPDRPSPSTSRSKKRTTNAKIEIFNPSKRAWEVTTKRMTSDSRMSSTQRTPTNELDNNSGPSSSIEEEKEGLESPLTSPYFNQTHKRKTKKASQKAKGTKPQFSTDKVHEGNEREEGEEDDQEQQEEAALTEKPAKLPQPLDQDHEPIPEAETEMGMDMDKAELDEIPREDFYAALPDSKIHCSMATSTTATTGTINESEGGSNDAWKTTREVEIEEEEEEEVTLFVNAAASTAADNHDVIEEEKKKKKKGKKAIWRREDTW